VPVVRYLVDDVDEALPFYELLGFTLADRWGPPFAIVERDGLSIWLSGPGTSARKTLDDGSEPVAGGWNRVVINVKDIEQTMAALTCSNRGLRRNDDRRGDHTGWRPTAPIEAAKSFGNRAKVNAGL